MVRPRHSEAMGRSLLVAGLLAAAMWTSAPAGAAESTVTFQVSLPARTTDWTDTLLLPRFDPTLGDLRTVDLKLDSRMDGTSGVENLTAADVNLTTTVAATVAVARPLPGAELFEVTPSASRSDGFKAYDGVTDFDGDSGRTRPATDTANVTLQLTSAADLTLFTGTTPIALPTTGTGASSGPGAPDAATSFSTTVNAKITVTYTYVTDTRPPDPPTITSSPAAFTSDPNPVFGFTAEPGATTECQLVAPATTVDWTACTSPWTTALGVDDDGTSTFSVRATDAAGNVGDPAQRTFVLDRLAPAKPTFGTVPPAVSQSAHPTWTFTVEPGATARCSLDSAPPTACASPQSPDLTLAADGTHTLTVLAVDAAGNQSPSASSSYVLDRKGPSAPTVTAFPPDPGNDTTPTWSFGLAPDATGATCSVDGGSPSACTSPFTANLTAAADGLHTVAIGAADAAGNASPSTMVAYHLDQTAPDAPTITGPASPSKDPSPSWTVGAELGSTTECRLDGGSWTSCPGSFTTTFPAGSDGVHLLTARARDQAGNLGAERTVTYQLDTTAPTVPTITIAPADPSNSAQPSWTFIVDTDAIAECSVDGGSFGPCTTAATHTADLTTALDGLHTFAVRATDVVGNTSATATSGFTLDRDAPVAPTITGAPASPGSAATVTWTYTVPAGTTTSCRIDNGQVFSCPSGSVTRTLATDGEHRFSVRARDAAGNRSPFVMSMYVLDRVGPEAPIFLTVPPSPTNTSTPQWTFQIEAGSVGRCALDGGPWVACTGSFTADLSDAADGSHQVDVQATDAAGNLGAIATGTVVLDRAAPVRPTFTSGPDASSADDTPTWTFTVDADASAECRVDDGAWVPCAGTLTTDLSASTDGIHGLEVRATDAVGNVGPSAVAAYELDRAAPVAPVVLSAPVSPGREAAPHWAVDFEAGAVLHCTLDGVDLSPCDADLSAPMADDGHHAITLWVVDAAGNTGPSLEVGYLLDRVAPAAPSVAAPRSPDHDDQPMWGILVDDDAAAECTLDDGPPTACGVVFQADSPLADGTHRLTVVARDLAGNESAPTITTYLLDTAAPALPVITQVPDATHRGWGFTFEAGTRAECSIDESPWAACSSPLPLGDASSPEHLDVRATDRAGNRSGIASATYRPAPIAAAAPTEGSGGPAVGGDSPPVTPARSIVASTPAPGPLHPTRLHDPSAKDRPRSELLRRTIRPQHDQNLFPGPVGQLLQSAAEKTTIPGLVILVVVAFVALQNRIDRRDPKLANAPRRHEPEYLEFQ